MSVMLGTAALAQPTHEPSLVMNSSTTKWLLKKNTDTAPGVNFLAYFKACHRVQDLSDSPLHADDFFSFLLALPAYNIQI